MPTIEWTVWLDGRSHTIEFEHDWLIGQRTIRLDGEVVKRAANRRHARLYQESRHRFHIDNHPCEVRIEYKLSGLVRFVLVVDGQAHAPLYRFRPAQDLPEVSR